ncbi:hypothetical protein MKK70_26795 [Methylobacterium sp. E-041]|nr:hypothetical protein [Methylobacterium sp. E-041]MCJ2108917.1 hypothetical protein [Methylobacterium sp. E-041]
MRDAAIDFLDRFGEDVIAHGWTATDLFGVHPTVGVVRVDYCGALMINARRVEAIATIGSATGTRHSGGTDLGAPLACRCGRPCDRQQARPPI